MLAVSSQIDIDREQVLSHIGYEGDYEPSARIKSIVDDYIENYHDLIESAYSYVIRNIESIQGDSVTIEGSVTFESKVIARLLERCEQVAIFALTIGNHLEEMVAYLAENGLVLQATVLDAVGSGVTEKLAGFVEDRIRLMSDIDGLVTSRRFSPGYCDWDISQQLMVFRAVERDSTEVQLTDDCLMIPSKSLSGIIGIGAPDAGVDDYDPCQTCDKEDCGGRR